MVRESAIEAYLRKQVESAGGECVKMTPGGGFPDRAIFWSDGSTSLVEVKQPDGVISARQAMIHKLLAGKQHPVTIVATRQAVDHLVGPHKNDSKEIVENEQ